MVLIMVSPNKIVYVLIDITSEVQRLGTIGTTLDI
jgi:hypothetical protein